MHWKTGRGLAWAGLMMASVCLGGLTARGETRTAVTGLSHAVHNDRVRIIMEVAPVPSFASFTLSNPDRLVVDFPALDWQLPTQETEAIPYVAGIRYGLFRPDRARMVFDLTEPVAVDRIFTKPARGSEPGRLVLDLAPTSRDAFDARAGAPEGARWKGTAPAAPEPDDDRIVVAIDPGHGGLDPGASHGRMTEKEVVLEFSRILAAKIEAQPRMVPYLVRDKDEFVPLAERVARAHRAGAHVLISVHADAVAEGVADGMSVYKLSRKGTDSATERLVERENRADLLAGADLEGESDDLARLLIELAQRGTKDESGKLAVSVLESLRGQLKLLRTRPLRQGNFRVLKAPDIPSILLEIGFLNSARDRERLTDPEWRDTAATQVARGIADWMDVASPGFLAPR